MELRSLLTSGHSVALGVLALGAVQSALTLAMPTGGDSPPMGWTPMPDPAGGGAGSPPFPVNLTAEERAHPEAFDVLDFEVFSRRGGVVVLLRGLDALDAIGSLGRRDFGPPLACRGGGS